jgi:hypothetical protein
VVTTLIAHQGPDGAWTTEQPEQPIVLGFDGSFSNDFTVGYADGRVLWGDSWISEDESAVWPTTQWRAHLSTFVTAPNVSHLRV